jgi:hypothetical protein
MHTKFWSEKVEGRDHAEDLDVDVKIILELILGKCGGKSWTGSTLLRIGTKSRFL